MPHAYCWLSGAIVICRLADWRLASQVPTEFVFMVLEQALMQRQQAAELMLRQANWVTK